MSSRIRATASGMVLKRLCVSRTSSAMPTRVLNTLVFAKTGFKNGMRPSLPAGAYQIQVQQIVETVERRSIQDVAREIVPRDFATGKEHRHIQALQALAQPMTSRTREQNTDAGSASRTCRTISAKISGPLLPFGPVRSKRECRVGMKVSRSHRRPRAIRVGVGEPADRHPAE